MKQDALGSVTGLHISELEKGNCELYMHENLNITMHILVQLNNVMHSEISAK